MRLLYTFLLVCAFLPGFSQAETEPNNTFETANIVTAGQVKSGTIISSSDINDYFVTGLPTDGTVKIYVQGTNTGASTGYLYMYGYDKRKGGGQIFERYIQSSNTSAGATINDTITVHGRAADTLYFRIISSGAFSYNFKYEMVNTSENDAEPNNTFAEAHSINHQEEKNGHIGYLSNGTDDANDYYRTVLPYDGTVKLYVKGVNRKGATGYLYMYGYDRRKGAGQVFESYIKSASTSAGATIYDTITLHGRAADTLYYRIISSGAFDYNIRYEMVDTSENDLEPNNTFDQAISINDQERKKGHIGYLSNGSDDAFDYYQTKLPKDGTLKIYIEGTNNNGATGYLYMYGYDRRKSSGQIFGTYVSGSSNIAKGASVTDSIIVNGVLADTFYFRIQSYGAFKYSLRYVVVQNGAADEEPNNSFDQALPVRQGIAKSGEVGHQLGGITDANDYFVTSLPTDGTVKIYVQGKNTSGSTGYLYMYGYDRRKGQLFEQYIKAANTPAGATIYDTITVHGRAVDTFYFRIISNGSFSYNFTYEMVDTSENDEEPNNTFAETNSINHKEEKKGHIGYLSNGADDANDYYRTVLPYDGTVKIYVGGVNTKGATGYLYMYGYDRRKGQLFETYISSANTRAGVTINDTITVHGRAADTFYFRIISSGAFSYNFKYEMVDTSANDEEPNNLFEEAVSINQKEEKKGHIGYLSNGADDANDYYRTVLPYDGTVKIYVKGVNRKGATGYMYMYGYDRRKAGGQVFERYIKGASIAAGATIYDTITLYGRGADTFYFRYVSSGAFSYDFKYEMVDSSENDVELNNTFDEAVTIGHQETKKGHIGYLKNGTDDPSDYYRTILPDDGTVKIYVQGTNRGSSNGYLYMYGYDRRKAGGQVLGDYIAGSSIKEGATIYDTLTLHCRAADTFYFRVISSGTFEYQFKYEVVNPTTNKDVEPNNDFATSFLIKQDSTYNGHISYVNNGVTDVNDYYAFKLPSRGSIQIIVEATNTSGGTGNIRLNGYSRRSTTGPLLNRLISNSSTIAAGATIRDTITVNCLPSDTLFLRWTSSGCFTYSYKLKHIDLTPVADMTYEQLGHTVGFRPQLANATSFVWSFGDGDSSTLKYPMKTYKPGVYTARLIAKNSTCNYQNIDSIRLSITGVEYYTPKKTGVGGDAIMQIFGGGLDSTTKVMLAQGADTLRPVGIYTNSLLNHLSAEFNLHLVRPGNYDVLIQVPGQPLTTYPNGYLIDTFSYPVTSAEVQGPDRWRLNTNTTFKLVVSNQGNVTASGVVIGFAWPRDVSVKFKNKFIEPEPGVRSVIVDGKTYSLNSSETKFIYDNLETVVAIDSFNLKPYKGFMQYILLPHVPAGGVVELPFTAKTAVAGKPVFKTFTYVPNQRGSCETPNFNDYHGDVTAEMIDAVGTIAGDKNIPLKTLVITAKIGQKHAGSATAYASKKFWAWYDGYEYDGDAAMQDWMEETEANNAFALQTATDELGNLLFERGAAKIVKKYGDQVDFINKRLANNPNMSPELFDKYIDKLNSLPSTERLEALTAMYKTTKDAASLSNKLLLLQKLADDCPELQPQVDKLKEQLDKEINQRNNKDKLTNSVTSMDPNEINGPVGVGSNRYLNNVDRHSFTINFENVDTAQASAQVVIVRDTLDITKFDLSTFEFGGISIGDNFYRVPGGRKQFVIERPVVDQPLKVRINGSLDTASGIIEWQFTSIDTITKEVPVFDGFLPPNVAKPQGEGSVGFSVKPISSLSDGTAFINRASIIFDDNAPILTNTWQNILDIGRSNSTMIATVVQDTVIKFKFNGTDAVSGVGYYNLYASINDRPYIAFGGTGADTMTMIASIDTTYRFYVISEDKVGNRENKAGTAEATITVTPPLVIVLGNITATADGARNRIDWNTLHEDEGDKMVVEKSLNGSDFTAMTTQPANGRASAYTVYDEQPAEGRNYYRLKIIDRNGSYKYSKVVSVYVLKQKMFAIELYPNPVQDKVTLDIHGAILGSATVQVVNMVGSVVKSFNLYRNQASIDLSNQPKGVYLIKYNDDKQTQVLKIVKQ